MSDGLAAVRSADVLVDHPGITSWVAAVAALACPDEVVWCDGSRAEWERLTSRLVAAGTFVALRGEPDSFSACRKTNLAMLDPVLPGWKAETVGDDIAWLRFGMDGRLYAMNPEAGFFGVAPGTSARANPHAIATLAAGHSIFTNTALTDDGDVWWQGLTPDPPAHLTDWRGRSWTPDSDTPAAHPNSRYRTPIRQCPSVAAEWDDPTGMPISAILFGGRRACTIPLVTEAFDWTHGVFLASALSSETTAAAAGAVGTVRRDPMAMLPFLGYHVGDYFAHRLELGATSNPEKLPKIFQVNWFRRDAQGRLLWPGYGDNIRVLAWVIARIEGSAPARPTPIGYVPGINALDTAGFDEDQHQKATAALAVHSQEWAGEVEAIEDWYAHIGGDSLPEELHEQVAALKARLAGSR